MKKARFFVLALLTVMGAFFCGALPVRAEAEPEITVYITFEGYTLGHGMYTMMATTVPSGTSAMDLTVFTLESGLWEFSLTPWGGLDRIYGIHPGTPPNPPPFVSVELGEGADDGSLGTFDYSEESGWLFSVNHIMPDVGPDDFILSDGDVVRWQFSVEGWGADLGLNEEQGFWMEPPYAHADKSELIRMVLSPSASDTDPQAQRDALAVINNPSATSAEVEAAIALLLTPPTPPALEWVNPFADVNADDAFYDAVGFLYTNGWMIGTAADRFEPHGTLTRAMAVTLLWRIEGNPVAVNRHTFNDVPAGRWFSEAAAWAAAHGIINAGEYFYPLREVDAVQLLAMMGYDLIHPSPEIITRATAAELIYAGMR